MGQFMSRLCLNLLNSLPFPSEERPEAFQQPCSPLWWARATLSAHLGELPAFTLLRVHCAPALLQAVRTFPPLNVGTGVLACACDSGIGDTELRRSLGLAAQPV